MAEGSAESPCCEVAPKDVDSNVPEPEPAQVEGQLQRSYRHEAGGYGCQFVSPPPEELQLECSVCLQILRDPHLIDCCGHNFCQSCINCVQMEGKPCPLCNEPSFRVMHNKGLQRTLNGFTVYCTHRQDGCSWVGELRALDQHLNIKPTLEKQLVGCEFVQVACTHCCEYFKRGSVGEHQLDSCPQRPFSCDYCGNYSSSFEDVVHKHWQVCPSRPVPCPNECGVYPERHCLENHVKNDCTLTLVNCDFSYAGCPIQLVRKDMETHLNDGSLHHVSLLARYGQQLAEKLIEKDEYVASLAASLEEKLVVSVQRIDHLEGQVSSLRRKQEEDRKLYAAMFPIQFTMTNFEQLKKNDDCWYSPAFYTHPHGYKMCLQVYPNGREAGKGTHVSVYICMMRGDFDNYISWPFQGDITVQLLNQLADSSHLSHTLYSNPIGRVLDGERAVEGISDTIGQLFVPNRKLVYYPLRNCLFLKDDCLHFKVISVTNANPFPRVEKQCLALEQSVCFPPINFAMRDFKQLKMSSTCWLSPSFYTHFQGYRMCIGVYANGYWYGNGKGTHVSLYVHIMQGNYDTFLKWPFCGDVTVQLLNQLEDKEHITETFPYTDTVPGHFAGKVVGREKARGLGNHTFIAHGKLAYNCEKNCQYLKDDRLHFRVTKVKVRS